MHGNRQREVVLVGGGHAHVQVLRSLAMEPLAARLTVVVDRPIAVYSGMVPGFVAGQYRAEELEIDVVPLARRARARVILSAATGVDPVARRLSLSGRPSIPYDIASFDVGSTVAGLDLPGIRLHAFATRPIGRFVERVDELIERARGLDRPVRLVLVGGGAGGIELAFTLWHRIRSEVETPPEIRLVHGGPDVLETYPTGLRRRVRRAAERRGIGFQLNHRVVSADGASVRLDDGSELACDSLVWVAGAVSQGLFEGSGLPTDERGFVKVCPTLLVEGCKDLFAVGDCATLTEHPTTPKAGVYAVRQGPYLTTNLRALLAGRRLHSYVPQRDFLTLLNLGDGRAIGAKWGRSFEGTAVMRWKDHIDRKFMRRFQLLDDQGRETEQLAHGGMGEELVAVLCGGCAAKLGQRPLERALARLPPAADDPQVLVGLRQSDDAAVYRTPAGDRVVSSLDAFGAFTDDPFLVGRVAAANAVSDVQAKGARPRFALALVALPESAGDPDKEETLVQVLSGARQIFDRLGVTLLGGHTTTASGLLVGFQVEGFLAPGDQPLGRSGLQPGQLLVLTKPLGTGVLFHADMQGRARGPWIEAAFSSMSQDNGAAAEAARRLGAAVVTDVTGFGLAGHLAELLRASGVSATLDLAALPVLPGALALLGQGLRSTFHPENERGSRGIAASAAARADPRFQLLFDPQTSGGLLFGLAPERFLALGGLPGDAAARMSVIGRVEPSGPEGPTIRITLPRP